MKAAAFFEYGPADVLRYADVADPVVGPHDVLVRVKACGVNHSDLDSRANTSRWDFRLPWVLGAEFVGTVDAMGSAVESVQPGNLVTALLQYSCGRCARCESWRPDLCLHLKIFGTDCWGGYGELVSVPERAVIRLRPGDDPLAIAGGQCIVSTAWHMVNRLALVRPGDLVLVPSASGGVGSALVQCAKLVGATVVATAGSKPKAERVKSLGADEVVLRSADDLEYGPPHVLRYADVADPVVGPHDVLVRVKACGVNTSGRTCPCCARMAPWSPAARTPTRSSVSTW